MGTFHLRKFDTFDFYQFLQRSGYTDEYDFWSSLSGLSSGTETDHMVHYLQSLGYGGCTANMFYDFIQDQAQFTADQGASRYDLLNKLYQGSFGGGVQEYDNGWIVRDDDGNIVTDDDGNILRDDT